jgi:hypothetical protein
MATLEIDDGILAALRERAVDKGFDTAEEYVRFVLEQLVRRIREQNGSGNLTGDDEKVIQEKLRSLGYLE